MSGTPSPAVVQLKISLHGVTPPLWRRIQVPSQASLGFLHDVIQEAFGWEGYHLHSFEDDRGREWSDDRADSGFGPSYADEEAASLGKVLRTEGAVLWYTYDFGDDWRHRIEVEKILPADPGIQYPRCTGGRRADPPAEDIGGVWGLGAIDYLVTHPEEESPEHLEELVSELRVEGRDPSAFDPAVLSERLSRLAVRTATEPGKAARSRKPGEAAGSEDEPAEAEVFPVIALPPLAELARAARAVPLLDDALRLAAWCAPGRPVTPKGVLRPALARDAIEELRLWERDNALASPRARAEALSSLRRAGDIAVLDGPWRFATGNGLIAIRSGRAFPAPGLPGPADSERLLDCWREALADEVSGLDDKGGRILPGLLSMIGGQFASIIPAILKLLYRLPDEEWIDTGSAPGLPEAAIGDAFTAASMTQLLKILSDLGAAEVDWGGRQWGEHDSMMTFLGSGPLMLPRYRARLTPLGRHGIRAILAAQGHAAHVAGDLADKDARTLLDALVYYQPEAFTTELAGWLAGRDEATVVSEILQAASGIDTERARHRVTAITILTRANPGSSLDLLREAAAHGPDGTRHVAAGVLASLGQEPPLYRESTRQWLIVDQLTAMSAEGMEENLSPDVLESVRVAADGLWRCGHPATADALEALAATIRDTDKALAKQLRKSAYKARAKT
jgi:Plasmid pRiA4b ORF-3-like protein